MPAARGASQLPLNKSAFRGPKVKRSLPANGPGLYTPAMSTMAQLESEIQALPDREFQTLLAWMEDRHLDRLAADGFEPPELEAAVLRGLEGPQHEWNEALRTHIRAGWGRRQNDLT